MAAALSNFFVSALQQQQSWNRNSTSLWKPTAKTIKQQKIGAALRGKTSELRFTEKEGQCAKFLAAEDAVGILYFVYYVSRYLYL